MTEARAWTQRAWCPAHVTGFFQADTRHKDPYRQGSRGAGLNLALGVTSTVTIQETEPSVSILIDGAPAEAPVVETTVKRLLGSEYPAAVTIDLTSDVPAGQGFGVSGAGALSSAVALANLLKFPVKKGMWEAHRAEVLHKTGLGDVAGQFVGGAEMRITAGAMPMGVVERFAGLESRKVKIVCCVLDGSLSTAAVLGDAEKMARIDEIGGACVEELRQHTSLADYIRLARRFADSVDLKTPALDAALETADHYGGATQTMLGNALHLIVDPSEHDADDAARALRDHGEVYVTSIATRGVHPLRDTPA